MPQKITFPQWFLFKPPRPVGMNLLAAACLVFIFVPRTWIPIGAKVKFCPLVIALPIKDENCWFLAAGLQSADIKERAVENKDMMAVDYQFH
jgi:hypothetical protein